MHTRKRILITGGAGFLGSHLCRRLLHEGNDIICVDNFFTGTKENIIDLFENPHLGLAKRVGAKIFQASTSEVYGDPVVHPQIESYWGNVNPVGQRSCYDEGKRCAETLFFDYNRQHNLRIKVARIFNTYGPNMHPNDGRVVSNFIMQALQNKPITIYGDGSQTRSFCYVDDLIEVFVRFMRTPDEFTGPVNTGNPGEFTILELAENIIELTGSSSKIERRELPSDDPAQRQPDITLAKEKMGWEPSIKLEEGLKKTIPYFQSLL
jgi:UDP-glucuronate decarboxylase